MDNLRSFKYRLYYYVKINQNEQQVTTEHGPLVTRYL